MTRAAVFLDRDGTMNVKPPEHEYVATTGEFVWLPGAREGIARLARAGYAIAVISNQRGVARGLVSPGVLEELEKRIQRDLAPYGCAVETFRYCIHELGDGCGCRKPEPGMIFAAAEDLDLDLRRSWMIGDTDSDILAGKAAGCRTVLVGSPPVRVVPDLVAPSLAHASARITSERSAAPAAPP